jgi:agmatinase
MTYNNFLGLDDALSDAQSAQVVILPLPLEATVSYGAGTANGPAAIIAASQQVELYDREFGNEPVAGFGIHTLPPLELPAAPEQAVARIAEAVAQQRRAGKLVVALGGEHTVSVGVGRGLLAAVEGPVTVVQIDAHSDLREEYEGSRFSHACVARRLLDDPRIEQLLQFGVRSVSSEEVEVAQAQPARVRVWYSENVHESPIWRRELCDSIRGRKVYVTVDVDGLDPAIVRATGTPEPDGLTWSEALDILRTVSQCAQVIGMDCVELAPQPGDAASDFATAKLVYKMISYAMLHGLPPEHEAAPTDLTYSGLDNRPELWQGGAAKP